MITEKTYNGKSEREIEDYLKSVKKQKDTEKTNSNKDAPPTEPRKHRLYLRGANIEWIIFLG